MGDSVIIFCSFCFRAMIFHTNTCKKCKSTISMPGGPLRPFLTQSILRSCCWCYGADHSKHVKEVSLQLDKTLSIHLHILIQFALRREVCQHSFSRALSKFSTGIRIAQSLYNSLAQFHRGTLTH